MEWVLAAYLGAAHTLSAPLTVSQPPLGTAVTFDDIRYEDRSFAAPLYYGYRVAYFPSVRSSLGLEAEVIHLKVYAETSRVAHASGVFRDRGIDARVPINAVVQRFSISHGLNLLMANVVARRTIFAASNGEAGVQLIGRLGAGPTLPHAESTVDRVSREGYELGGIAFHASGGVEVRLFGDVALFGEYKFTRTSQTVAVDRGEAHGAFASHHAVFGVSWHVK